MSFAMDIVEEASVRQDTSLWHSAKWRDCGKLFVPRDPSSNPLYRIVFQERENLEYRWDELFAQRYGPLLDYHLKALDAYLNCGIFWHGCARLCCEHCGHSELLAFSCKTRNLCPSCDAKRAMIFAENVHQNILPNLPLRHLVWTIPKILRSFYRFDKELRGELFLAAWNTWLEYCKLHFADIDEVKTAAVMSIHLAGSLLNFHPHLHSLNLSGIVDSQGQFQLLSEIDTNWLEQRFQQRLTQSLRAADLECDQHLSIIESWEHSGFNIHVGKLIEPEDTNSRLFLARYLLKCPVQASNIELLETPLDTSVRYHKGTDDESEFRDFSPLEFLAQLTRYILNPSEQAIRFYGLASPRTRGDLRLSCSPLNTIYNCYNLPTTENTEEDNPLCPQFSDTPPERKPVSRHWASWIAKIFEVDPLECPKCKGRMKVKAIIHKPSEIERICTHLGIKAWKPPAPLQPP